MIIFRFARSLGHPHRPVEEFLIKLTFPNPLFFSPFPSGEGGDREGKARDARRLQEMRQIFLTLQLYYHTYDRFPGISADACCDGWDQGPCGNDPFIGALANEGLIQTPTDPSGGTGTGCYGYNYYRYSAGSYGCDAARGAFFVLGVRNMETSARPHRDSPGWSCPNRNWQNEFDWVTGGFEK